MSDWLKRKTGVRVGADALSPPAGDRGGSGGTRGFFTAGELSPADFSLELDDGAPLPPREGADAPAPPEAARPAGGEPEPSAEPDEAQKAAFVAALFGTGMPQQAQQTQSEKAPEADASADVRQEKVFAGEADFAVGREDEAHDAGSPPAAPQSEAPDALSSPAAADEGEAAAPAASPREQISEAAQGEPMASAAAPSLTLPQPGPAQDAPAAGGALRAFRAETEALFTLLDEEGAFAPEAPEASSAQTDAPAQQEGEAVSLRRFRAETEAVLTLLAEPEPDEEAEQPLPGNPALAASVSALYGGGEQAETAAPAPKKSGLAARILLGLLAAACTAVCAFALAGWRLNLFFEDGVFAGLALSSKPDEAAVLAAGPLALLEGDAVALEANGPLQFVRIARARSLYLSADGAQQELRVTAEVQTVEQLLAFAGIELGTDDAVSPAPDTVLAAGDAVTVQRIRYEEVTEEEILPAEAVVKQSPLLGAGSTIEIGAADKRDGARTVRYRDTYTDGVRTAREPVEVVITAEPVNSILLTGASVAASPLNGAKYTEVPLVGGVPQSYKAVYSGGCTAYSYEPGVWGASGMYLIQGFVAVDPDVIPLGSLLYITSPDGSFVYGWAVAADVCEASVDGRVVVDCFFETYRESQLFGRHTMDVYVVAQLHQGDLAEYIAREGYYFARIPA